MAITSGNCKDDIGYEVHLSIPITTIAYTPYSKVKLTIEMRIHAAHIATRPTQHHAIRENQHLGATIHTPTRYDLRNSSGRRHESATWIRPKKKVTCQFIRLNEARNSHPSPYSIERIDPLPLGQITLKRDPRSHREVIGYVAGPCRDVLQTSNSSYR